MHRASLLIIAFGVAIALLYYGRAFCVTLVISVILAFLLEPFVVLVMRLRIPRGASAFIVCCIALLALYTIGFMIVSQVADFADDLPYFSRRVNELVDSVAERLQRAEQNVFKLIVPKRFQAAEPPPTEPPAPPKRRRR